MGRRVRRGCKRGLGVRMKQPVQARLYDLLQEQIVLAPMPNQEMVIIAEEALRHTVNMRAIMQGAKVIEASNVAKFFRDTYVQPDGGFDSYWTDLKCLVPPHERLFIEWNEPLVPNAQRMGVLMWAFDKHGDISRLEVLRREARGSFADGLVDRYIADLRCRWIYLTAEFVQFYPAPVEYNHPSELRGPFHFALGAVSAEGDLLDLKIGGRSTAVTRHEGGVVAAAACVAWTTLAMMNCQNIETVTGPAVPAAFQKARAKKGRRPLIEYHTIRVDMTKTPRSIQRTPLGDVQTPQRLHERRGHLKDYRKGAGLFGRYKGLWYWGPQLAGSEVEGVVLSDYEVK